MNQTAIHDIIHFIGQISPMGFCTVSSCKRVFVAFHNIFKRFSFERSTCIGLKGDTGNGILLGKAFRTTDCMEAAVWAWSDDIILNHDTLAFHCVNQGGVHVSQTILLTGFGRIFSECLTGVRRHAGLQTR